ncbi:MAG: hypothetical protein KDA61_18050, partial [Planctomycetales bacterium]|nr:hypothetical protein [Planctomycetales bacterium]
MYLRVVAACLLTTLTLACDGRASERRANGASPLAPSILAYHKPHHDNSIEQMGRALQLGFRRIHLVATLFCQLDDAHRVTDYGVIEEGRFTPLDADRLATLAAHYREIFAAAKSAHLEVAVTAHLNAWGPRAEWRNHFDFDPLASIGGFSYANSLIEALVAAHYSNFGSDAWELSVVGEMGGSVFRYPQQYAQWLQTLKADPRNRQLNVGVSLNFNDAADQLAVSQSQWEQFGQLLQHSDFVGMSLYRPIALPVDREHFDEASEQFLRQFDGHGFQRHRELPLVLSEIGLGGGREGNRPASTPAEAALAPWEGVVDARRSPWSDPTMQQFRRDFHRALLQFLEAPRKPLAVQGAYLWSEGSWDPLDIVDHGFFDA